MHLILIHRNDNSYTNEKSLFRDAISTELIGDIIFDRLIENYCLNGCDAIIAVPQELKIKTANNHFKIAPYDVDLPICFDSAKNQRKNQWNIISNGRFITQIELQQLGKLLANRIGRGAEFDNVLIAVNVEPTLLSYHEKLLVTTAGNIAGFRRFYRDSVVPTPVASNWPHHIFVKSSALEKILIDGKLPLSFAEFVNQCAAHSLDLLCFKGAGAAVDLETETGLLNLLGTKLRSINYHPHLMNGHGLVRTNQPENCVISADARLFGKIMLGNNVRIDNDTIIIGPTILGDNVKIATSATVRSSVIGPDMSIPENYVVQNRILVGALSQDELFIRKDVADKSNCTKTDLSFVEAARVKSNFRTWPMFSYARYGKRIGDIIFALLVLTVFTPLFPVIAIAIKLSSSGPVFFRHKRQGLHGKEFYCLKFRTMVTGADKIQEKLRFKNQVDGPQFKVEDDPRVTFLGRFLRDTFIDEIPQFINILLGQMSVVGPRPSPSTENSLCPFWHDARLSVRPGITGLWQIRRTRRKGRDFQEWIYYDTKYVRNLSFRLDLSICRRTAKKLLVNFIKQF